MPRRPPGRQAREPLLDAARSPLPWLAALLALYLLAPIVAFVVRLHDGLASAPGLGGALLTSLLTATVSAALIGLLGVPLAYLLARARGIAGRLLLALVCLPLALPPLMSGLLLLYVVGPYTAAGRLFGGQLTDTRAGIVLAQTFVAAPFLIVAARAAFAAVDPSLEEMARALGHGRLARFWHVALPSALPGIGAGLLLAWLRSFGEFGATVILAYHPYSLPVFTFVQFGSTGLPATTLPVALALAAALVVLLASGLPLPALPGRARRVTRALTAAASPGNGAGAKAGVTAAAGSRADRAGAGRAATSAGPLDFALRKRVGAFSLELTHRAHSRRLALLGPSGAGKTLTLRLLAGVAGGEGGHVHAGELELHALPCERRQLGYVPQHSALVPRRTLWRQVAFGARARPELAAHWIARLGLDGLEDRLPHQLSGGQQRRVALARALASQPRLLLLDEPFTGLDAPVRDRLRRELRRLQREQDLSTVIVTHDPEEAAMLADEVIVIEHGHALQAGPRGEVFRAPASPRVAALLGIANARRGRVAGPETVVSDGVMLRVGPHGLADGREVVWCVRPEHVRVEPVGARPEGVDGYRASLRDALDLGAVRELTVALEDALELTARSSEGGALAPDVPLRVRIAPEDVRVWAQAAMPADAAGQPPM